MARKSVPKIDVALAAYGEQFPEGSNERRAWDRFVEAESKYAAVRRQMEDPKFDGKDDRVPDKYRDEWVNVCREVDRRQRMFMHAFDAFDRLIKFTIHVPHEDVKQVILAALSANADALGWEESGRDLHRHAQGVATELFENLKATRVKIYEDDSIEPPMCDDCLDQMAA